MHGITGGIGDAAPGFLIPADDDDRKTLSGLACERAHQQNGTRAVTAQDEGSAAHEMLKACGKEIKKATPKFSSDLKAASTSNRVQPSCLFDNEAISQRHHAALIDIPSP